MSAYDRLLANLNGHVRKSNERQASALCPAHEDSRASLSVRNCDGRAKVKCFAGCEDTAVLDALGLTVRDLFDNPRQGVRYDYTGLDGLIARTVTRKPDKSFPQTINDPQPILYRLPEVIAAVAAGRPVHLAEGETDADTLTYEGHVGTSAPMGASSFNNVDVTPLRGAHVVAIVDRDNAGRGWAKQVQAKVKPVAASLTFKQAKVGNDTTEHVMAGFTIDQLDDYSPTQDEDDDDARRVILTPASTIKPQRVKWLWKGRLALGTLGLIAGKAGLGKSTIGYWLAARVTRGDLPGEYAGTPKGVLVCATEDSWEHTIVPRLMAAGADLNRIYRVEVKTAGVHVSLTLPRDLAQTRAHAEAVDAALLLLDPLMSRLGKLDPHKDAEVRQALEPLASLADQCRLSVIGLIHHNKSRSTDPLDALMASVAFGAVARSVHTVVPDPHDETNARRLFGMPKNNLGTLDLPTLTFTITGHAFDTDDGTAWTSQVVWGDDSDVSIGEAMRELDDLGTDRTATNEAADWLSDYLTTKGGTDESAAIKREGNKAGHSSATLSRARKKLKVTSESVGFPRKTWWTMPTLPTLTDLSSGPTQSYQPMGRDMTETTETTGQTGQEDLSSCLSHLSRSNPRASETTGDDPRPVVTLAGGPLPCQDCGEYTQWRHPNQRPLCLAHGRQETAS